MKKSTGITKLAPRITDKSAEFYKKFQSTNAGVEYVLEAFPELFAHTMHDLRGKFTRGELMLFIDVMNGHWYNAKHAGQEMPINVADGQSLDKLNEKWETGEPWPLNKKLLDLTWFERACIEIWIQAFWNQDDHSNIEEYVAELVTQK